MRTTLFLVIIFTLSYANSQGGTCPDGWTKFKDEKCYILLQTFSNFATAKESCESLNGSLAIVKEEEEQLFLTNHIFETSQVDIGVWIGGTRGQDSPTEFQWEDGSSFDYANWAVGSPTELDGRNCVQMLSNYTKTVDTQGTWRDTTCNSPLYYVCETTASWSLGDVIKVLIQTRKELDETKRTIVPIGFIYTQLPEQPTPSTLWPAMTWTDVTSQFAGKFFRAGGGSAAEFGETQNADSPRLSHVSVSSASNGNLPVGNTTIIPGTWSGNIFSGSFSSEGTHYVNRFLVTNAEVRPINTAVRIWKRLQ